MESIHTVIRAGVAVVAITLVAGSGWTWIATSEVLTNDQRALGVAVLTVSSLWALVKIINGKEIV